MFVGTYETGEVTWSNEVLAVNVEGTSLMESEGVTGLVSNGL